jgi:membrane protease YdiL (CAAX protease family)
MGVILTAAALSLTCLLLCLPAFRARERRGCAIWGVVFVFVLTLSTDLRDIFPGIPRLPEHYNWTGKFFECLVDILAIFILLRVAGWSREELGLRMSFRAGTGRDVLRLLVPIILVETVVLWFLVPGQRPGLEDHLFQLSTPGLTEELAFRGVLLALLDRAFTGRVVVVGAGLGWGAAVTSIIFGLWHGLDVDAQFRVSLDLAPMAIPTLGGFVLAWCRARSGSIVLPIAAHAGMNEVANLIALAKAP